MSDDSISRQAAIDANCVDWCNRKHSECPYFDNVGTNEQVCDGCYTVLVLKDLPPAQPKWTPIEEGPPKANGRYLVTRGLNACGAMWNRVYIINYSDLMGLKSERIWWDGNVGKSDFERIDDVLAWMPLPKRYERSE